MEIIPQCFSLLLVGSLMVIALIAVYVASGSVSTASVLMMCGFGMILLTTFAGLRAAKKAVTK